jgi:hypothetical protein
MNIGKIGNLMIGVMIGLILLGVGMLIGGPMLMQGFDATVNATNASQFTLLQTIGKMGPGLIILGVVLTVAFGVFLGVKSLKSDQ